MKKLLQMKFMLLLCALIVGSGTMWAADPITLWSEDFSSYSANDVPSGGTYNYSCGGANTMIYDAALAGGKSPELLLQKSSNGTFTATIPLDNIEGDLTLTFKTNNQKIKVETTTNGLTGGLEEKASGTHTATFKGVTTSTTSITIKFTCSGSSNVRLDDIVLTGTKSSGGGDTPTTWTVTYDGNGATSGSVPVDNTEYDSENSTVTVLGNTGSLAKEHYTFNNWNTADDGSGTGYVAGNTFTISGNTTLYAQWAINSHNVTLPAQNEFGAYTMSAVNPVAYGTEVTLTYNPASGYEKYVAAWSVNGTALEGNKFTMPDEDVTVTVELTEITIDFESAATAYTDWTFTNIVSNYSTTGVTAHGGSKYGSTDGKASGSIQTKERVNPASLTCYVSKESTNTSASSWYIQVSSDGTTWENVTSRSASNMSKGEWKEFTANLSDYSDVYVRVYYGNNTARRCIDDLTLVLKNDTRAEAGLAFDESSYSVELFNAASFASPVLQNPNELSPITWTSTNETVATVNEGTVTILGEGETTIKAKFEGNDDYKPGEASYVLTVQDSRLEPTVTIHDTFITHTNVFEGTAAGPLTASVKYNDEDIEGATVTWSGNNDAVATINATSGSVDLVAPGTVTFTATYAGNADYSAKTATYEMTVTYSDPNAPGTENNPYTVAEARAAIDAGTGLTNVYATGIVSQTGTLSNGAISYYISDDGTTTDQLQAYKGKGIGGANFTSADDIQLGDIVVIKGNLKKYNSIYEFDSGNELVSLVRKPAAPTFSPAAGTYTSTQYVTISAADGAAIYYTTDGTSPTTESNLYSEPIEVNTDMTIKAIAVKDSEVSDVATAEYVIDLTPSIVFDDKQSLNVLCTAGEADIHFVASNITGTVAVVLCDANGGAATYDWFSAALSDDNVHIQWQANEDPENSRTAFFKLTNGTTTSELFALTQAKYVPDYATLPFIWEGGSSADLTALNGVTASGLGSDYNDNHSPYLVKLDNDNDYIQIKTDRKPTKVTIGVKMIGGGNTSTITVQESSNGETFTNVQALEISGNQNTALTLETTNAFAAATRYVRLLFTKGSNVGVGPIKIEELITLNAACHDNSKIYGTYYTNHKYVMPETLVGSTVSVDNEGKLVVSEVFQGGNIVPANTALLISTTDVFTGTKDYSINISDGTPSEVGTNYLRGTLTANEETEGDGCLFYRLTMHNGETIGFWWGAAEGGKFKPGANKAYLAVPTSVVSARNGFAFGDDSTTGISNVNVNENVNGSVFDLQGRKVSTPGKGLYIVNGKKVVIK